MLQIAIDDAGAFLAGADLAFEDFVGVGRAPVRGWRKGGAGFFFERGGFEVRAVFSGDSPRTTLPVR